MDKVALNKKSPELLGPCNRRSDLQAIIHMARESNQTMNPFDLTIQSTDRRLDSDAIARIEDTLKTAPTAILIEIDLSNAQFANTAGFAALVVMRRRLLASGRDLRISGLHDKTYALYRMIKLGDTLPLLNLTNHDTTTRNTALQSPN